MDDRTRRTIADLTLAALTLAGSALLLIGAMELPPPRFEPLGSAALPRILATLLILFAVIVAIRALLRHRTHAAMPDTTEGPKADPRRGALVFAALVAYVFALDVLRIPFLIATPVFVAATGLAIGARTWTNLAAFAALGLALAFGISLVLEKLLYVRIG